MILNSVRLANRIDWNLALEIEERRKTGKELKNSNLFLGTIVENIPHMIFVKQGEELRFTSINKAGEKLLNIPRAEYIGKTDDDFFPPEQAEFFKQKDREVYKKDAVLEFEEPVDTSNGTIWLRTKKFPIKDENGNPLYLVGISEDITEKRKQEEQIKLFYSELEEKVKIRTEELSNSEKRFRALIENSTDGITITNEDFVIVYESPAVKRMTGYSLIERGGTVLFDHIHPDDVAKCREFYNELNANPGKPIFLQYRMRHSQGEYLWVEGTATNLLHEESVKATIFNYRDVTERKNHEHERELLIQELTRHNKDLRQFSYITSHNLRAPLSNLLGLLGLIKFINIEDPSLKDIIEGFNVSTNSLNDTINDLLHILYVKENVAIAQEEVPVFHLLQKVITQVSNLLEEIDPDLVTNLDTSDVIYFNKAYLESIFLNLLTNAIKYRSTNRKLKLTILLNKKDGKTILTFEDNGIGLDLNKCRSKVFGLYQRFHNHPDSKGLGLYLVKTQVEALGGTIDIESEVERGTKFILTFNKSYAEQSFVH
jgi:PAS domain S-box-containing protein